ncbi:CocE/NonD family hydrolase [Planctomycetaceae bacterium SH139]
MRTLRRMVTNAVPQCLLLLATLIFLAAGTNFRSLHAQQRDVGADVTTRRYAKQEVRIPMRDGVTLHTTIYSPSDRSVEYPILLSRTPYGCGPYGDALADPIMYNAAMVEAGYTFVYQDLRSRSMSDGDPEFENLRPVYSQLNPDAVDEVTDAHDTIEWLLANVDNHNKHVGMFGSSYMGFTALMGSVTKHPNLKAVLAAAPCVDIYFEDFNRNGMFTLAYVPILDWFGTRKFERHEGPWWENQLDYWADGRRFGLAKDSYDFYLRKGTLSNYGDLIPESNYFWKKICEHPNYDEYRQSRNALQYLQGIECPVLIVGGFNDEQNLYGIFNAYKTINANNPRCDCRIVVGPWAHSEHKKVSDETRVGDLHFGERLVDQYQVAAELAFFEHHLKGDAAPHLPELSYFDTGAKRWIEFEERDHFAEALNLYLDVDERLARSAPKDSELAFEYVSDPAKPVPYIESDEFQLFPAKSFMTSDQRHASKRPDVLTFATEPLESDLFVVGPIIADLKFSTDHTDADIIVKVIDVLPMDRQPQATDTPGVKMNGYQQLVRCGQIRGRYRDGYSSPRPLVPGEVSVVQVELLDVCHTFKAGHRIMVQIQSSLFPLFDRNPQNYVENIYQASDADFAKAIHSVHTGSRIQFHLVPSESRP